MADPTTARQQRILDFIAKTVNERGYPPTVREIGEAVGLNSSSSVHAQLANLQKKGLLDKDASKPRAVRLSEPRADGASVPLVGRIAAGTPVLAEQNIEDLLSVPKSFVSMGFEHFALSVTGDSMIGAGIFDGDTVIVRAQDEAQDGDIVVALIPGAAEEEATVKRLKHDGPRVILVPENPDMQPFEMFDGRIAGKVVAVLRKL